MVYKVDIIFKKPKLLQFLKIRWPCKSKIALNFRICKVPTDYFFRNQFFLTKEFLIVFCNICIKNRSKRSLMVWEIYKEIFYIGKLFAKKVAWWETWILHCSPKNDAYSLLGLMVIYAVHDMHLSSRN